MNTIIRPMEERDREHILNMMRTFYRSPAVHTNGSEEIFQSDIDNCVNENPYLEGYVFEKEHQLLGYAMVAKSFSTEFGKHCCWIEDLYLTENSRGLGLGGRFFDFIEEKYPNAIFRLEVEEDNLPAVHLYTKKGYSILPYQEMKK